MIKTIKKIDICGNEIWQEVFVCDKCKKVLENTDYVYEIKWTGWHPVKMERGHAYGFSIDGNPTRHICENCQQEVEKFITGQFEDNLLKTLPTERLCPCVLQNSESTSVTSC